MIVSQSNALPKKTSAALAMIFCLHWLGLFTWIFVLGSWLGISGLESLAWDGWLGLFFFGLQLKALDCI